MNRMGRDSFRVDASRGAMWVGLVCLLVGGFVLAIHSPGHISMDTSMQLYEAMLGKSISWNPPFMSALMRWLGGGEIATALLVFLTCGLIYGGYALIAFACAESGRKIGSWRILIATVVVLNPIVAIYVGIVWKDVIFAAFLCGGTGFGFAAVRGTKSSRWMCALISAVLLAGAMLARQQGIFMAPVLLVVPILMLADGKNGSAFWARWLLVPAVFLVSVVTLNVATAATIQGNAGRSTSIGYRSIMIFDMMGILHNSPLPVEELAYPVPPEIWGAIRQIYKPSRIDTLDLDPAAGNWFGSLSPMEMRTAWWALLKQNPGAYMHHRVEAYAKLIGLRGMDDTLPVHIGVEGNPEMLNAMGISERRDSRDRFVYSIAVRFFDWPIYRHVFWMGMVVVCGAVLGATKLPRQQRSATALVLLSAGLLYLAYVPTMIAADFRYLFGAMPLVCMALISLLLGSTEKVARSFPRSGTVP